MKKNQEFKAGEFVILAEGEYSDYRTGPLFRCLKNLDMKELAEAFHSSREKWRYRDADASSFTLWLSKNGWVEEVAYAEVHVGSYGRFECCGFTAPDTED